VLDGPGLEYCNFLTFRDIGRGGRWRHIPAWQVVEIRRGRKSGKAESGEKAECMGYT
jgi:hypothetical protein